MTAQTAKNDPRLKIHLEMSFKIYLSSNLWTGPQGTYYPPNNFSHGFDSSFDCPDCPKRPKIEIRLKIYLSTNLWTGPQGTYYPTNHFSRGFDSPAAFWLAHDDLQRQM